MESNFYESRVIKALEYLDNNLEKEILVEDLARASNFSSFHFHRIYKSLIGETPYETILRLRLEKAVFFIKNEVELKLKDISALCGFSSYENFSRQFKNRFGISANDFKLNEDLQNSRIYHEFNPNDFYTSIIKSRKKEIREFSVVVEELNEISIAFVRAFFGADGKGLIEKYQHLMDWAEKNKINYTGEKKRFGMSIDNIEVTPSRMYRYDFAIALKSKSLIPEGLIEIGKIPSGKYATIHCVGKLEDVAQAWDYLYKSWLPQSNYKPIHYPALEEFVQGPEEIGWDNFNIKCRVPIEEI